MRRISIAVTLSMALIAASSKADTDPLPSTAPPVAGCDPMEIGPVYDASLDASAKLACFQLVTPTDSGSPKLDVNFAGFRTDELHQVDLIRVDPDGSTHAVASDASTDAFRIVQANGAPSTRWLILVGRPATSGVSPFQLQATVAYGSDSYEPNDSTAKASVLRGNQRIEANLDSAADTDHYLIVVRADQEKTIIEFEAAPGVVAELIDGANQQQGLQAGQSVRVNSSHPIFVSVRAKDAVDAGTRYTLRTRDPKAFAVVSKVHSNEKISHLAPGRGLSVPGGANAARTLEVEARVYEGDGSTPVGAGQRVVFNASDVEAKNSWPLTSVEAVTDDKSIARATLNIGPCKGGILGPVRMHTLSNRPEYWDIAYNPESVVLALVSGSDQPFRPEHGWQPFQHVCREVYRGYRP